MTEPRPLMVRQTIRRVFVSMFGQQVAQRGVPDRLVDQIDIVADILARDLSEDPRRGFRWKTRPDLLPMARRWAFMSWLVQTGRWQSDTTAELEIPSSRGEVQHAD